MYPSLISSAQYPHLARGYCTRQCKHFHHHENFCWITLLQMLLYPGWTFLARLFLRWYSVLCTSHAEAWLGVPGCPEGLVNCTRNITRPPHPSLVVSRDATSCDGKISREKKIKSKNFRAEREV